MPDSGKRDAAYVMPLSMRGHPSPKSPPRPSPKPRRAGFERHLFTQILTLFVFCSSRVPLRPQGQVGSSSGPSFKTERPGLVRVGVVTMIAYGRRILGKDVEHDAFRAGERR